MAQLDRADAPTAPEPPKAPKKRKRDRRIDVLRGLCVLSMTSGHLAPDTWIDVLTHPLRWVDGAPGFVALSGLVLGIVQRRMADKGKPAGVSALKMLRRAGMLMGVHLALLFGSMLVRSVLKVPAFIPTAERLGGWPAAIWGGLTLQVQPDYLDVLPLYIALLAVAPVIVLALRVRLWWLVMAASSVLFVAGQWFTEWRSIAFVWPPTVEWHWLTWQFLFVGGMVWGWYWEHDHAPWPARHPLATRAAAGVGAGLFVVANFMTWGPLSETYLGAVLASWFGKYEMRPGTVIYLVAAVLGGYLLAGWMLRHDWVGRIAEPLALVGSKTLDAFVLLTVVQLVVLSGWPDGYSNRAGLVFTVCTVIAQYVLAVWRTERDTSHAIRHHEDPELTQSGNWTAPVSAPAGSDVRRPVPSSVR